MINLLEAFLIIMLAAMGFLVGVMIKEVCAFNNIHLRFSRKGREVTDIKKCPFCGSDDVTLVYSSGLSSYYYIRCEDCNSKTDFCKSKERALLLWNRRAEQ